MKDAKSALICGTRECQALHGEVLKMRGDAAFWAEVRGYSGQQLCKKLRGGGFCRLEDSSQEGSHSVCQIVRFIGKA